MGGLLKLKELAKERYKAFQEQQRERKEFQKELNKKIVVAKRESFSEEAVKQAKLRAKAEARLKFNPPPNKSNSAKAGLDFAINFDEPSGKSKNKFDPLNL